MSEEQDQIDNINKNEIKRARSLGRSHWYSMRRDQDSPVDDPRFFFDRFPVPPLAADGFYEIDAKNSAG